MVDTPFNRTTVEALLASSPYQRAFSFRLCAYDPEQGRLSIAMPFSVNLSRVAESDQIHGGAIASLIDVAGTFALAAMLGRGVPTITLTVDYLRPAAGEIVALAIVRRAGKTVANVDITVTDAADREVATGRVVLSSVAPR